MRKRAVTFGKTCIALIMSLVLAMVAAEPVLAVTISELQKQQQESQQKLDKANSSINSLKGQQSNVGDEIEEIDTQLVEVIASVELIEEEIADKEAQIKVTEGEYNEAKAKEDEQYAAMKLRIKYMYEQGDVSYVQLLMESSSFSDMLNKADYIEQLYEYDRRLLTEFQETKAKAEALWNQLEDEKSELQAQEDELQEEKDSMEAMLEQKKKEYSNYDTQIAKAKQEAAAYKTQVKQATAQIKKIQEEEAKKAAEAEKARQAALAQSQSSDDSGGSSSSGNSGNYGSASSYGGGGQAIANYACQFIGNPYVAGGTSLTNGADCSGFVWRVYKDFGYSVPRTSSSLRSAGQEVSTDNAQPGDIVCYAGHVGIYIGGGTIVHASTQRSGIKTTSWTYKPILSVRRIT